MPLPPLVAVVPGQRVTTGAFAVEFVRVAHSIPDASALAIDTPAGTIVFTGDYKLDDALPRPPPARRPRAPRGARPRGRAGAVRRLHQRAAAGPHAERGDDAPRRSPSRRAPRRPASIVTCFASHIDRIDHAMRAADAAGRAVAAARALHAAQRRDRRAARRAAPPARPTVTARAPRRRARPQLDGGVHGLAGRGVRRPGARGPRRASAPDRQPHGHDHLRDAAGAGQRGGGRGHAARPGGARGDRSSRTRTRPSTSPGTPRRTRWRS